MRTSLRGCLSEKYDSTIFSKLPQSIKHDLVVREIKPLTSFKVNVVLLIAVMEGLNITKLMSYFRAGEKSNARLMVFELAADGYLRQTIERGASGFQSSRKFYLTGKGRELVKRYYELMNG